MKDSGGIVQHWLDYIQQFDFTVTHSSDKNNINADLISRAKHMDEPYTSDTESITKGKEDIYSLPWKQVNISPENIPPSRTGNIPWSQVNNCSEYTPPSCTGKICTIVQFPWHLATANGIEGGLIGTIQGKIVLDQTVLK